MHIYIASNKEYKKKNRWFVGTSKLDSNKIKEELISNKDIQAKPGTFGAKDIQVKFGTFIPKDISVDLILDSPQAKEILASFQQKIGASEINKNLLLVEGDHSEIAQVIQDIAKEYESKHPSLRRSFLRWLENVESWEQ